MSGFGTRPTAAPIPVDANRRALAEALLGFPARVGQAFTGMANAGLQANEAFLQGRGTDGEDMLARPLLPGADTGGRLGALASFVGSNMAMGGPAGSLGAGPSLARTANALPMDEASRMARAAEMGFDTSRPVYHATPYEFSEFVPSKWRGASYLAQSPAGALNGAAAGGMEHMALSGPTVAGAKRLDGTQVIPAFVRGKIFGKDPFPEEWLPPPNITRSEWQKVRDDWKNWTPPNADQFSNDELGVLRHLRVNALDRYDTHPDFMLRILNANDEEMAALAKIDEPMQRGSTVARPSGYESIEGTQNAARREALKKAGYTGTIVDDEAGYSVAIFDPKNIRSRFAAFDPARSNEADLLASFGPNPLAGALLGYQPQE